MEQRIEKLTERLAAKAAAHTAMEQDYNKLLELTRVGSLSLHSLTLILISEPAS